MLGLRNISGLSSPPYVQINSITDLEWSVKDRGVIPLTLTFVGKVFFVRRKKRLKRRGLKRGDWNECVRPMVDDTSPPSSVGRYRFKGQQLWVRSVRTWIDSWTATIFRVEKSLCPPVFCSHFNFFFSLHSSRYRPASICHLLSGTLGNPFPRRP